MNLTRGITVYPVLHSRIAFGSFIRTLCNAQTFDCVALDIPEPFGNDLPELAGELPVITAVTARNPANPETVYYIPVDPCDPMIEALRQARQKRIPCRCIGYPELHAPDPLPPLPDEYAIQTLGFDEYSTLCLHAVNTSKVSQQDDFAAQYSAYRMHELAVQYDRILVLLHFRHFSATIRQFRCERTYNLSFSFERQPTTETFAIHPDHLYFALGELPFITAAFERERQDVFAKPVSILDTIKDLFCSARDEYLDARGESASLSPVRIQRGLAFLRNLTILDKRFIPCLFDIITAAQGIGGNTFAIRMLKCAKYYPYLPFEQELPLLQVGIDRVFRPGADCADTAVNLFRDTAVVWKTISIKPDPTELRKKKYRYFWNPYHACSHVPEDERIENFNTHVRGKALRALSEDCVKTEKFETSVKDGIDIRETLRRWHTGSIYVRELPPARGALDTVVLVFDEDHDERYTHRGTWYAEHPQESTLTFYGTDPLADLIGPGIARSTYGGVSLLFPPRRIPGIFEMPVPDSIRTLAQQLIYGALLFSAEPCIACVSVKKPDIRMKQLAARLKKCIIWIPLNTFSAETIRKLRNFHILNGKDVRSWASRFICD